MTDREQLILNMYSEYKKKKTIIVLAIICILLILSGIGCFLFISSQSFDLDKAEIVIEYGTPYSPSIGDFVENNGNVTCDNTVIESNIKNEDGKSYASIGNYDVKVIHTITYRIRNIELFKRRVVKTAKVIVKDTTSPQFNTNCPSELSVMQIKNDSEKPDLSKYFTASDLSGISEIRVMDVDIDYKIPGSYSVDVIAIDTFDNTSAIKCNIIVYSPELVISQSNIEIFVGDTSQISVQYKGDEKPVFVSSDDSIVKVDNDGKIKALRKGECYVTVSCNGLTQICNIIVIEKTRTNTNTSVSSNETHVTDKQSSSEKHSNKQNSNNYPEKEFLFVDGYTMENVADAAYAYLKASGKSGRCVPIKNSEGIYLGMRVEFD